MLKWALDCLLRTEVRMKRSLIIAVGVLLLAGLALAATSEEPPQGWPNILWALLGILLPWVWQHFLVKFPGWARYILSWGITLGIVVFVDLVLLHWTFGQLLGSIGAIVIVMQSVYQLWTKPVAKARAIR